MVYRNSYILVPTVLERTTCTLIEQNLLQISLEFILFIWYIPLFVKTMRTHTYISKYTFTQNTQMRPFAFVIKKFCSLFPSVAPYM